MCRSGSPASAEVVRTGEPGFVTTGTGSVAMLPLTAGEERLGVLGVSFPDERALSAADREYLAAVGGICALALARAAR